MKAVGHEDHSMSRDLLCLGGCRFGFLSWLRRSLSLPQGVAAGHAQVLESCLRLVRLFRGELMILNEDSFDGVKVIAFYRVLCSAPFGPLSRSLSRCSVVASLMI